VSMTAEAVPESTIPFEEGCLSEVVAAFFTLDPAVLAGLDKCSLKDTGRSDVRLNAECHREKP
jgi:hypothetical protein